MARTKGLSEDVGADAPRPSARPRSNGSPNQHTTTNATPRSTLNQSSLISESDNEGSTIATADIPGPPILRNQEHAIPRDPLASTMNHRGSAPSTTENTSNPQRQRQSTTTSGNNFNAMEEEQFQVKAYMASLGTQENVNVSIVPPGAVPVRGIHSQEINTNPEEVFANHNSGHWDNIDDAYVDEFTAAAAADESPLVAQLAPDDADVAARVAERLERQMTEQWEERLKREVEAQLNSQQQQQQQLQQHQQQNVVVRAEAIVSNGGDEEAPSSHPSSTDPRPAQQASSKARPSDQDDNFKICGLRRRTWGFLLLLILVFVVGGVVGMVWYLQNDDSENGEVTVDSDPTLAPSLAPSINLKKAYLLETLGPEIAPTEDDLLKITEAPPNSPQSRALAWLVDEDRFTDVPEDLPTSLLLERYALAVLYYSTAGPNWRFEVNFLDTQRTVCDWNSDSNPAVADASKNPLVTSQTPSDSFAKGVICARVDTNRGVVQALYLKGMGLAGRIPWELSLLPELETLELDENFLLGTIPPQISALDKLETLWINKNSLTGPVPNVDRLPSSLISIDLSDNALSGSLPSEWGEELPLLYFVSLGLNNIEGPLPSSWRNLVQLQLLDLGVNDLTSSIPAEYGITLQNLRVLFVEGNQLGGSLPTELAQLTNLQQLWVFDNQFIGTIPTVYSELVQLQSFLFNGNALNGSVDPVFCAPNQTSPEFLRGDCLSSPTPETAEEIKCSCCTTCCSTDGLVCQ